MTSPATTAARLRALAASLSSGSPEELEAIWATLKATASTRELYHSYPDAVSAIVAFARMKANGEFKGDPDAAYREMTGKVADAVAGRVA